MNNWLILSLVTEYNTNMATFMIFLMMIVVE